MRSVVVILCVFVAFGLSTACGQNKKEIVKIKTSAVCGMCKDRIEKNIAFEKGVSDVVLDNDTKVATVTYNPKKTNPDKIRQALSKLGYDADGVKADQNAYNDLPPCCKKDSKTN